MCVPFASHELVISISWSRVHELNGTQHYIILFRAQCFSCSSIAHIVVQFHIGYCWSYIVGTEIECMFVVYCRSVGHTSKYIVDVVHNRQRKWYRCLDRRIILSPVLVWSWRTSLRSVHRVSIWANDWISWSFVAAVFLCCACHDFILSLIHIWRCRRIERCRSRWSPYH